MHHFIADFIFYAFLASLVVVIGYACITPMVDRMNPAKLRATVVLWTALFLLAPAGWSALNTSLGETGQTYLHELGHEWVVYTMFLSGLLFSLGKRWRQRP